MVSVMKTATWNGIKSGVGAVVARSVEFYKSADGTPSVSYTWSNGSLAGASACTLAFFLSRFSRTT